MEQLYFVFVLVTAVGGALFFLMARPSRTVDEETAIAAGGGDIGRSRSQADIRNRKNNT